MIADLSSYQGDIDWGQAFNHLDFAILRASVVESVTVPVTVTFPEVERYPEV